MLPTVDLCLMCPYIRPWYYYFDAADGHSPIASILNVYLNGHKVDNVILADVDKGIIEYWEDACDEFNVTKVIKCGKVQIIAKNYSDIDCRKSFWRREDYDYYLSTLRRRWI